MTADIINLRKVRKAKQKAGKDRQASENRIQFGRSKSERTATAALIKLDTARIDGAFRANPESAKRSNPNPDDDLDPGSIS